MCKYSLLQSLAVVFVILIIILAESMFRSVLYSYAYHMILCQWLLLIILKGENVGTNQTGKKRKPILRKGESQHSEGKYQYRWTDDGGKRHSVYASTLEELRKKEEEIQQDQRDLIKPEARNVTLNDMFHLWKQLKRGLKDNTFQNYLYMYEQFVAPSFGRKRISTLLKSDVKRFYNTLSEERGLAVSTVDNIHTVLHQILDMAVDDMYIRRNPSDDVMREFKKAVELRSTKRRALTKQEQDLFLDYLRRTPQYQHWYPVFAILVGTGLRVGEAVGLRWCDIDLEHQIIDVNHTLVYYRHAVNGCYCNIHTPKTVNGIRQVPMLGFVKEAFLEENQRQKASGICCEATIDGYTDFIFVNRFGQPQHQGTLNKALRRIIRDCNDEIMQKNKKNSLFLPHFSCHSLRHTFTTRMCEAGLNIKVIQDVLGHADVSTTLNIYADATKRMKTSAFASFEDFMNAEAVF